MKRFFLSDGCIRAALGLTLGFTLTASAATWTVNDNRQDYSLTPSAAHCIVGNANTCTLRDAIVTADANDTIVFDLPANSTIMVEDLPLMVDKNLTIDGADSPGLTVSGGHAIKVFHVASGVEATFKNFAIKNGDAVNRSLTFAFDGADFTGRSLRVCGSRPAPDPSRGYNCFRALGEEDNCPCYNFTAEGKLIDLAGDPAAITGRGFCPSSFYPEANWDFQYEVFSAPNCGGVQLNNSTNGLTCFGSKDAATQLFPNQSVNEVLVRGTNTVQVICTSSPEIDPGSYEDETITVDLPGGGTENRSYRIYRPSTYNDAGKTFPLIVALHGDTGSASGFYADFGLHTVADKDGGGIIVYPNADPAGGGGYWSDTSQPTFRNRVAFIEKLVTHVVGSGKVSPGRVFITGASGGGRFANEMVCGSTIAWKGIATHASDTVSGVAYPAGGWTTNRYVDGVNKYVYTCAPLNASIAALQTHNIGDKVVDFSPRGTNTRDHYRVANKCAPSPDLPPGGFLYGDPQPLPANLPTALGAASPCVAFQGCDKPEVWCPIPAAPEPPPTDNHSQWPYAAQVTWEFFAQQP